MNTLLRSEYGYDTDSVSVETALVCPEPSLTVQSEKEDADINTIVKRFGITGHMPSNPRLPMASDYVDVEDFRSAMQVVREAQEAFMELPADVREKFHNDPAEYHDFCTELTPTLELANIEAMRKMGLAKEKLDDGVDTNVGAPVGPPAGGG